MESKHDHNNNHARAYGWRRQLPDRRDELYAPPAHEPAVKKLDLRDSDFMPPVYNQGSLGSCTANAIAAAFEFCEAEQGYGERFTPSRLFIYYNERSMEGSVDSDAGAEIRDGIKSINKLGVCPETEWPYDVEKFTERPDTRCYHDALKERALKYQRVEQHVNALKHALATEKRPVVFGFTVYESFESETVAASGVMPMPEANEKVLGGHAVMACGFDDEKQAVLVRNSWGASWGERGYFWMPYAFISDKDMADDFWMVETIDAEKQSPVDVTPGQPTELMLCGKFAKSGLECQAGRKVKVMWRSSRVPKVTLQYCLNSWTGMLSSWTTIEEGLENKGCYEWTVPEDAASDTRYWLRVSSAENPSLYADSEYFAVVGDTCSC